MFGHTEARCLCTYSVCATYHTICKFCCKKQLRTIRFMMTSWNWSIFRVTGLLCGEFTGEFPAQRPVTRTLMFSLICAWINGWVNSREAGGLRRHPTHYDVIVMSYWHNLALPTKLHMITMLSNTDAIELYRVDIIIPEKCSTLIKNVIVAFLSHVASVLSVTQKRCSTHKRQ